MSEITFFRRFVVLFSEIHYEGTLPTHFDTTNLKLKGRNFVSNSRYGNMYILR